MYNFYSSQFFYPVLFAGFGLILGVTVSASTAVVLGIAGPLIVYLIYAFSISHSVNSPSEFFLAAERLQDKDVYETLAATWLLLGNVTVANMLLGAAFGFFNAWLVLTWAIAFIVAGLNAERISDKLGDIHTLHEFLGARFGAKSLRIGASIVTFIVSTGIIALELVVGMAIILPITNGSIVLSLVLGFVFVLVITGYSVLGGLRAIVETDRPQVGSIIIAMVGLFLFALIIFFSPKVDNVTYTASTPEWPFWVGLFFLQVPLLIGDFGTWQRIRASSLSKTTNLKKAFNNVGWLNVGLWSAMVIGGMAVSTLSETSTYEGLAASLFSVAEPVAQVIDFGLSGGLPTSNILVTAVLFVFTLGLVSAMLSSADSYLLIGLQTVTEDIIRLGRPRSLDAETHANVEHKPNQAVSWSRLGAIIMAVGAYSLAFIIIYTGQQANALQIVFIVFGAQTVLSPLAVFALREDLDLKKYNTTALVSGIIGFFGPAAYGVWSLVQTEVAFHSAWGPYLVPVGAVCIPLVILILDIWRHRDFLTAIRLMSGYWGSYR